MKAISEKLYAVKIIRKDGSAFFSCGKQGRFNTSIWKEAVQWKKALAANMPCSIKRIKVIRVTIKEDK